jgi:hypothetical protein
MDYCGVLQFTTLGDSWLWGGQVGMLRVGENRAAMINRLSTLTPQDMPDFEPSMRLALNSLIKTPASVKHMIIISDGDPTPPSPGIVGQFAKNQIKSARTDRLAIRRFKASPPRLAATITSRRIRRRCQKFLFAKRCVFRVH